MSCKLPMHSRSSAKLFGLLAVLNTTFTSAMADSMRVMLGSTGVGAVTVGAASWVAMRVSVVVAAGGGGGGPRQLVESRGVPSEGEEHCEGGSGRGALTPSLTLGVVRVRGGGSSWEGGKEVRVSFSFSCFCFC